MLPPAGVVLVEECGTGGGTLSDGGHDPPPEGCSDDPDAEWPVGAAASGAVGPACSWCCCASSSRSAALVNAAAMARECSGSWTYSHAPGPSWTTAKGCPVPGWRSAVGSSATSGGTML